MGGGEATNAAVAQPPPTVMAPTPTVPTPTAPTPTAPTPTAPTQTAARFDAIDTVALGAGIGFCCGVGVANTSTVQVGENTYQYPSGNVNMLSANKRTRKGQGRTWQDICADGADGTNGKSIADQNNTITPPTTGTNTGQGAQPATAVTMSDVTTMGCSRSY